jgi:hypothetical protein
LWLPMAFALKIEDEKSEPIKSSDFLHVEFSRA